MKYYGNSRFLLDLQKKPPEKLCELLASTILSNDFVPSTWCFCGLLASLCGGSDVPVKAAGHESDATCNESERGTPTDSAVFFVVTVNDVQDEITLEEPWTKVRNKQQANVPTLDMKGVGHLTFDPSLPPFTTNTLAIKVCIQKYFVCPHGAVAEPCSSSISERAGWVSAIRTQGVSWQNTYTGHMYVHKNTDVFTNV